MSLNTNLLVTTYHWVKRQQPEAHQWNQGSWRCPHGMCFASWLVTLAGEAEWLTPHDRPHAHRLVANSDDHPSWTLMHNGVRSVDVYARALRVLGFSDGPWDAALHKARPLFEDLVKPGNQLGDLRHVLTRMLGRDPELETPDELLFSTFAKDDWTKELDPALATRAPSWASGCGCPACRVESRAWGD